MANLHLSYKEFKALIGNYGLTKWAKYNWIDNSKNLVKLNNLSDGYLNQAGKLIENASWKTTDYTPVEGGFPLVLKTANGNAPAIVFYDKNKNYITGYTYNNLPKHHIKSPDNAKYFRMSLNIQYISGFTLFYN